MVSARAMILASLALAGCQFSVKGNPNADPNGPDGGLGPDGTGVDAAAGCFGPSGWIVCPHAVGGGKTITGALDTSPGSAACEDSIGGWPSAQPAACFVVGTTVQLTDVIASGSRPLVVVATETITITGVLDIASHREGTIGPGAPATACEAFKRPATSNTNGGGGGAGGSFGTAGGNGGDGDQSRKGGEAADADTAAPSTLRAGCAGQRGGESGGTPGQGGGAVYLVAGVAILGPGSINASGAAGTGGGNHAGGSGGGSGGLVVLSAPSIMLGGVLANGAGASSGSSDTAGGASGDEANPLQMTMPALGGIGQGGEAGPGGRGGNGAAGTAPAMSGASVQSDRGGGGGGGGLGAVRANIPLAFPVSPAPTIVH